MDAPPHATCAEVLCRWTGKSAALPLYDSDVDEFTATAFCDALRGRPDVAVVGVTTEGDLCGAWFSEPVTACDEDIANPALFAFVFPTARHPSPRRYAARHPAKACVEVCRASPHGFINVWVSREGGFWLGNERSRAYCANLHWAFDGLGDESLTGRAKNLGGSDHHCQRLVVVQMV